MIPELISWFTIYMIIKHLQPQMNISSPPFHYFIFHFLFVSFLHFPITEADAPTYLNHNCSTTKTFPSNSSYHFNLYTLFSTLSSHSTGTTEFYNTTVGGGGNTGDTIYGLFMCRGDVTHQMCRDCIAKAIQNITSWCLHSKEAIIWYHECFVRYSNRSFFSTVDEWPRVKVVEYTALTNSSEQGSFGWVLANTLNEAVVEAANAGPAGTKKFVTKTGKLSGIEKVYTLVQCSEDLSSEDCRRCLGDMMGDMPFCCLGRDGGMVLYPSCSLMFCSRQFYREVPSARARLPPDPLPPPVAIGDSAPQGEDKTRSRTIVLVVVPVVVSLMLYYFYFVQRRGRKNYKAILRENFGNECTTLESLQFDLATIVAATNRFSNENRIGQGGFGEVYKGILHDGQEIAVKRLSTSSEQGAMEFKNEVLLIAKLQHRNLVTLLGFCLQGQEKILVYEFVPNKSLDYFLFDSQNQRLLNWSNRYKIIGGIAQAILYLHEHSRLKIIHRDLKPSNTLLDNNMNPKISDFGMARMVALDQDQGRTRRIVGTYGYMPPEYVIFGKYSEKSDIFSFGVMILEIISGRRNGSSYESHSSDGLFSYAWKQWRDETTLEIMDPNLRECYCESEVMKCIQIGLLCVQENPDDRPSMARIVSFLSGLSVELPFPGEPAFFIHGRMEPNVVVMEVDSAQPTNNSIPCSVNEMSISRSFPR